MTETELLAGLRNRDADAFRILVDSYQRMTRNCAYRFVRDAATAEDLTQEVFMTIFESIDHFRGESKLSTWIYRITISKSLNHLKAKNRKKRFAPLIRLFNKERIEQRIPLPQSSLPAYELENKEGLEALMLALAKLPENQRVAFTLCKQEEMSYEMIADIMHTSIPAVESLLHRAKNNLKKLLYKYYSESI